MSNTLYPLYLLLGFLAFPTFMFITMMIKLVVMRRWSKDDELPSSAFRVGCPQCEQRKAFLRKSKNRGSRC